MTNKMKFAIIAAGEGSRLSQEGADKPKPLIELNGEAMIDRLVRIFAKNGAEEIDIIVNEIHPETKKHVLELKERLDVPVQVVCKTTPSSMHSFYELSPLLKDSKKFCLTTVDTIFREDEFGRYIEAFKNTQCDGMMAVTDYIDDEKPLYVSTDTEMQITGFHDSLENFEKSVVAETSECKYISGGIYCLSADAIGVLEQCIESGQARMRNFQRQLVASGLKLKACAFSKILDVDHISDVEKAEEFLNKGGKCC